MGIRAGENAHPMNAPLPLIYKALPKSQVDPWRYEELYQGLVKS
jgi:hypothetical protein